MTETQYRDLEKRIRKLHKTNEHINFLTTCSEHDILPNFTILSAATIKKLNLKKPQIYNYRKKIFNNELEKQKRNLNLYTTLNDNLFHELHEINPTSAKKNISIMKSLILSSELLNDQTRRNKLNALIRDKSNFFESPKIAIFNTTALELPDEISKLLESGLYAPIGGFTHKKMILAKFEEIWVSWKAHAELKKT